MGELRVVIGGSSAQCRKALADGAMNAGGVHVLAATGTATLGARVRLHDPEAAIVELAVDPTEAVALLRALRGEHPALPLIAVCTGVASRSRSDLARAAGATAVVASPSLLGASLRALPCGASTPAPAHLRSVPDRFEVLAIGASTGGPNALARVLSALPANLPVPVLLVQHMPAEFTPVLAQRLDDAGPLRVREARGGETPVAGEAWLAPGGHHLILSRGSGGLTLGVTHGAPESYCRPSVDVLFRTAASAARTLGVVLTGMGQDGLRGALAICNHGGAVLAQDEETSVVWGMPGHVARAGIASAILPLDRIAPEILVRCRARVGLSG